MRTSNLKHYGSDDNNKKVTPKKVTKGFKAFSLVTAVAITAAIIIIPTTTLAPDVDAHEDSKFASLAVGSINDFSGVITNNCVEVTVPPVTEPATTAAETTAAPKEESSKEESSEDEKAKEETTQEITEPKETEESSEDSEQSSQESETSESSESSDSSYSGGYLGLSAYDRAKVERLVMGEAGSTGYYGCALVAQCIRDAMVRSNTTSIDEIISDYGYYGSTGTEPNGDVKDAVSFIFDQNGSAVDHRIIVFYIGSSAWHETQNFVTEYCGMRFFDLNE